MNKTEQLLIRACKSKDPYTRVRSVYRRYYLLSEDHSDFYIAGILSNIFDKHCKIEMREIFSIFHPDNYSNIMSDETEPYSTKFTRMLISKIRLTTKSNFKGLTSPMYFRSQ